MSPRDERDQDVVDCLRAARRQVDRLEAERLRIHLLVERYAAPRRAPAGTLALEPPPVAQNRQLATRSGVYTPASAAAELPPTGTRG